ncbi:MAG: SCP2 sterol-binding domain-containing protein [Candidatus Thorarchaeota archaeon]|nr:SCP2 sterol-binding domain-containing protein [Candidatus Thorarchaeota archaeon]
MADTSPETFFEKALPKLFRPKKAKKWNRTIQYHITDAGDWYIIVEDQQIAVHKGNIENPQMVVEGPWEVIKGVYTGEYFAPKELSKGTFKIEGPMMDHIKWSKIVSKWVILDDISDDEKEEEAAETTEAPAAEESEKQVKTR